ncbi:peptide chain release factor N(5)-glutamine methyltransferase [Phycisphaerales bacterium AB-hyl4]|uniref:Release factor glutamine methyltransferase n=1 Tax=Natronomicrosphaera hydrolytica TaxID=3242702 RepID=A0ABV4U7U0_9BACT
MNRRTADSNWTTRRLLEWTAEHLKRHGVDSPRLSSEMLLSHVLGVQRLKLYMDPDRPASELERAAFRELVERASQHEPVDYLVGQSSFFSMMFKVSPAVLVPRPSTETVVEHVIQHARRTPGFHNATIADVCTGSGAIAVALAKHMPHARVIATDLYEDALAIARENAKRHDVSDRIEFRHGNLLDALGSDRVQYLVSNPPYISDEEWDAVAPNVKDYEPVHALRSGVDGLRDLRVLIAHAREHLARPGQVVFEIAASQKKAVLALAEEADGLTNAHVLADHEGLPRVLVADAR